MANRYIFKFSVHTIPIMIVFPKLYEVADRLLGVCSLEETYKPGGARDPTLIIGAGLSDSAQTKLIYRGSPIALSGEKTGRKHYSLIIIRGRTGQEFLEALSFSATSDPRMVGILSGDFNLVERIEEAAHIPDKNVRRTLAQLRQKGMIGGFNVYQFGFDGDVPQTVKLVKALMDL